MSFFGAGSKPMSISGVKPKSMKRVEWVHHAGWRRWSPETPFSAFILSGAGSAALFTRWPSAASTKRRWLRATPLLFSFGMSSTAITCYRIFGSEFDIYAFFASSPGGLWWALFRQDRGFSGCSSKVLVHGKAGVSPALVPVPVHVVVSSHMLTCTCRYIYMF